MRQKPNPLRTLTDKARRWFAGLGFPSKAKNPGRAGKRPASESEVRNLFRNERPSSFDRAKRLGVKLGSFSSVLSRVERDKLEIGFALAAVGVFLVALSAYLLFFSSYFRIAPSKVVVERTDTLSDINIAYKSLESVYGTLIFGINSERVTDEVRKLQPNVTSVAVSRLYPQGVKVILSSSDPAFVTRLPGEKSTYVVTANGVLVYDRSPSPSLPSFELVDHEFVDAGFYDYKAIASAETMSGILALTNGIRDKFRESALAKVIYFRAEQEAHIVLESGTILIFELRSSVASQLAVLKVVSDARRGALAEGKYVYIDLRSRTKVFLCPDKTKCRANLARIYGSAYVPS